MNWWLIGLGLFFAAVVLYRLDHYFEWRRTNPGRHAYGHVEPVSRDGDDPITDILPIVRDEVPIEGYDPGVYRLARAVRRWTEYQSES